MTEFADSTIYIVIPCYNCADKIERCVRSIHNSASLCSKIDYYISLVNDKSTDGTYYKLEELASKYPKVFVENNLRQNHGPGAARNYGFDGIECMQPEHIDYIWFIDADDWIEPETFNKLYDLIKTFPDIICMSRYQNDEDMIFHNEYHTFVIDDIDVDKINYINRVKIIRAAWDKLYRYAICQHERFAETYRDEESLFTFMAYLNAKDIVTINDRLYHYEFTDHGASAKLNISDNLSTWWQIAEKIRHNQEIREKYPKLIPYAFDRNVFDISISLAEQMNIDIDKYWIKCEVDKMVKYALMEDGYEKMVCSI